MYQTLGLDPKHKPTAEEIKKAYKKKALQWHPDRNRKNPKLAESKFKDINEAYEILSNPEKRQMYDLYGSTGPPKQSPFHFTNSSSPSGFTFSFPKRYGTPDITSFFQPQMNPTPQPIIYPIYLSLEELSNPTSKQYKISLDNGQQRIITIPIKPGWKSGTKITHTISHHQVQFVVYEKSHPYFKRINNNLQWICSLQPKQARQGVKLTIDTPILNEKVHIDTRDHCPQEIEHLSHIIIPDKGMPIQNTIKRGHLLIQFKIL
jgi:DnaJ-class molecular chaperone